MQENLLKPATNGQLESSNSSAFWLDERLFVEIPFSKTRHGVEIIRSRTTPQSQYILSQCSGSKTI